MIDRAYPVSMSIHQFRDEVSRGAWPNVSVRTVDAAIGDGAQVMMLERKGAPIILARRLVPQVAPQPAQDAHRPKDGQCPRCAYLLLPDDLCTHCGWVLPSPWGLLDLLREARNFVTDGALRARIKDVAPPAPRTPEVAHA